MNKFDLCQKMISLSDQWTLVGVKETIGYIVQRADKN